MSNSVELETSVVLATYDFVVNSEVGNTFGRDTFAAGAVVVLFVPPEDLSLMSRQSIWK